CQGSQAFDCGSAAHARRPTGLGTLAIVAVLNGEKGLSAVMRKNASPADCQLFPFCFAHRRFCARLIFRRAAADIVRRLRGRLSIVAAGSVDMSILVRRFPVAKSGKLLMSAAIFDFSSS